MDALELAQHYFDLSNAGDLDRIRNLMTESTTYSSQNTGIFLGVDQIMDMQAQFHGNFATMGWEITAVDEIKPGIVRFDFVFSGTTHTGEQVRRPGIEYVVVHDGKLQHIEIRNAASQG